MVVMDARERANRIMARAAKVARRLDLNTRTRMFAYSKPAVAVYGHGDDYLGTVELDGVTGTPKAIAERWVTKADRKLLEQFRASLIKSLGEEPISP